MAFISGNTELKENAVEAQGAFVIIDGERFYQISGYDAMQPFFISIASDTDLWMYLSSTGGVTAGRVSPDKALFPYYTDDRITESAENTGSKTVLHVRRGTHTYLWEPFSDRNKGAYIIERSIAKSTVGNKIRFSEKNIDLGLIFTYTWSSADRFGWIRKASLQSISEEQTEVELVDGLQNVLPSGTDRLTQNTFSTLVDAYKKTELVPGTTLGLFRMEAIMVDRAEPSESLRANTIWNYGLDDVEYFLSSRQLDAFRSGQPVMPETEAKGVRGAMLVHTTISLQPSENRTWYFVADVAQDIVNVRNLITIIKADNDIPVMLESAINKGTEALKTIVAQADGIQHTADAHGMARHFANTLFNTMRGGFYCDGYTIKSDAFAKHVALFNSKLYKKNAGFLISLPQNISLFDLEKAVLEQHDAQLHRLFLEYLPLTFGRRHGDPSRPWNLFNIKVNDEHGNRLISYQGNWRDIFQNWEALSLSYPAYINGIIAKFLNATTVDGYNPYKISSEGIEWEVIEPENPWSNIGYWGDHQIIYLQKLLELSYKHYPTALTTVLNQELFAFSNVPYRLKSYAEIVADPKNSIRFDTDLHKHIFGQIPVYGQDARLVLDKNGHVVLGSFTDKILITLLAKLSNFVPEAGIWMNTLRPEWNDANNALVGCGASMVTLYYMRRFVSFIQELYASASEQGFSVFCEIGDLFHTLFHIFSTYTDVLEKGFDDCSRRAVIDELGTAGEAYRTKVYAGFLGGRTDVLKADLLDFFSLVIKYIDQSICINRRSDGMYHAYNLVSFGETTVTVNHLYEMLEGQVAVLSSMNLSTKEVADLLDVLRHSALYRADQNSYILYPNKRLPSFLEKNNLPTDATEKNVIKHLLTHYPGQIVVSDNAGGMHFNADFNNVHFLTAALDKLPEKVSDGDRQQLLDLYEQVFNHKSFTGRSGSFYKYEGLGCIYWHMVSKLLLSIGENIQKAMLEGADEILLKRLKDHYLEVKKGIGAHKSPAEYGSFPFDPYSHTPTMAGVQQPGMTGQVKEDIINRFFELGINVANGEIHIEQTMLDRNEFLNGKLSFTYCQTPFVYELVDKQNMMVQFTNGSTKEIDGYVLDKEISRHIFDRDETIRKITVYM